MTRPLPHPAAAALLAFRLHAMTIAARAAAHIGVAQDWGDGLDELEDEDGSTDAATVITVVAFVLFTILLVGFVTALAGVWG